MRAHKRSTRRTQGGLRRHQAELRLELSRLRAAEVALADGKAFPRALELCAAAEHAHRFGRGRRFSHKGQHFTWCVTSLGRVIVRDEAGQDLVGFFPSAEG